MYSFGVTAIFINQYTHTHNDLGYFVPYVLGDICTSLVAGTEWYQQHWTVPIPTLLYNDYNKTINQ